MIRTSNYSMIPITILQKKKERKKVRGDVKIPFL